MSCFPGMCTVEISIIRERIFFSRKILNAVKLLALHLLIEQLPWYILLEYANLKLKQGI